MGVLSLDLSQQSLWGGGGGSCRDSWFPSTQGNRGLSHRPAGVWTWTPAIIRNPGLSAKVQQEALWGWPVLHPWPHFLVQLGLLEKKRKHRKCAALSKCLGTTERRVHPSSRAPGTRAHQVSSLATVRSRLGSSWGDGGGKQREEHDSGSGSLGGNH